MPPPSIVLLGAIGVGAGILSGLFGVGGGVLMVPAMVLIVRFAQHRAHATSLAAIVPIAALGALIFGSAESVDLAAAVVLTVGSMAGVQIGTKMMGKLTDQRLAQVFGAFLIIVAVAMLR